MRELSKHLQHISSLFSSLLLTKIPSLASLRYQFRWCNAQRDISNIFTSSSSLSWCRANPHKMTSRSRTLPSKFWKQFSARKTSHGLRASTIKSKLLVVKRQSFKIFNGRYMLQMKCVDLYCNRLHSKKAPFWTHNLAGKLIPSLLEYWYINATLTLASF